MFQVIPIPEIIMQPLTRFTTLPSFQSFEAFAGGPALSMDRRLLAESIVHLGFMTDPDDFRQTFFRLLFEFD
jgi:hypothetical protein